MDDDSQALWATRFLFRVAPIIFIATVGIGIVDSFHVVDMSRAVLLTHVHAGTLGWITISAWAAAFWLFAPGIGAARGPRPMAIAFTVWVPLYVLAFTSGNYVLRAIFGVPVLGMILVLAIRLIPWGRVAGWTTPRIGVILAFLVLVIGSTIGVLYQIQLAINHTFLSDGAIGGHAAAQVGGYLVLFALSAIDWRLKGTDKLGWAGGIQVVMLALGGLFVAAGAYFSIQPLLGLFIPLDVIALVIFLVRLGGPALRARWMERGGSRHYAIAIPWVVINLVTTIAFIIIGISSPGGFNDVPVNLFIAADHAIFIGVMTNLSFGMIQDFTAGGRAFWPWADDVVFWVMNIALAGFFITLVTNVQAGEKFFVPFQGLAILIGIVAYTVRLSSPPAGSASPAPAPAT
jgi:hypothetical protein